MKVLAASGNYHRRPLRALPVRAPLNPVPVLLPAFSGPAFPRFSRRFPAPRASGRKLVGCAARNVQLSSPPQQKAARKRAIMGSPQDPRTARRKRERAAKKNALWDQKRAAENAEAAKPKAPPKKAT